MQAFFGFLTAAMFVGLFVALAVRLRGPRRPGGAATGAVHDLLIEDKRKAIEIIIEQKAEATDPETKDGDLPQLEHLKRR